ncbi:hypothetical protein [Vagococcus fessus]|uniref:Uncharacterized protein n=1 Tax=Vagococcus fessus TaxID=120370 RepID=A0A430A8P5_9ENTE|nr:hypothetical protein [Vagococcus fessus]RSU03500.1 hypothetical protein CBF31_07250 [Vagococcus fessus]
MDKKVIFSLSPLFFWVKGYIEVDSRFVKTSTGNTILGFIPAGKANQSIPLKNISAASLSSQYKIKPFIIGIIIIFIALSMIGSTFLGALIMLLIGVGVLCSGILTTLVIQRAGSDYYLAVPFFEKKKLLVIQDVIIEALANDADKTDLNQFMDKKDVK